MKKVAQFHVLHRNQVFCDRLGKNISGAGLDTNIIGRCVYGYTSGQPWLDEMPRILRIVVMELSEESDGNAVGMGLVDFVPERFTASRPSRHHAQRLDLVLPSRGEDAGGPPGRP